MTAAVLHLPVAHRAPTGRVILTLTGPARRVEVVEEDSAGWRRYLVRTTRVWTDAVTVVGVLTSQAEAIRVARAQVRG